MTFGGETTMSKEARNQDVPLSPAVLAKYEDLVALLAADKYGAEGPTLEATFAEIEEYGHRVGRMVARGIDARLTAQQGQQLESRQACPSCQSWCEPAPEPKARLLQTVDGDLPLVEQRFHCPVCDRDFFPSASRAAD